MKHTEETKRKLSEMRRGSLNPFYGKKHTPEFKQRMSKLTKAWVRNPRQQFVVRPPSIHFPSGIGLGYLAATVDDEGTIGFNKSGESRRPFVAIYNTSIVLMEWLVTNVGGRYKPADYRGRSVCYTWHIGAACDVFTFCRTLAPLLIIKKSEAEAVIAFLIAKYPRIRDLQDLPVVARYPESS
jgi:hypothetical protein